MKYIYESELNGLYVSDCLPENNKYNHPYWGIVTVKDLFKFICSMRFLVDEERCCTIDEMSCWLRKNFPDLDIHLPEDPPPLWPWETNYYYEAYLRSLAENNTQMLLDMPIN